MFQQTHVNWDRHQLEIQAITGADGRRKKEVTLLGIPARQQEVLYLIMSGITEVTFRK